MAGVQPAEFCYFFVVTDEKMSNNIDEALKASAEALRVIKGAGASYIGSAEQKRKDTRPCQQSRKNP